MEIKETKAHFVGIGGVGMSSLAQLFHSLKARVSGSDIKEGKQVKDLRAKGIQITIGHSIENVSSDTDVVIYSSAVDHSNSELQTARQLRIPIIPRAEALGEIMRFKRGIAVGGTHGKTTTTSMIGSILLHSGRDPTITVGGRLKLIESTARLGQGPWMVAEADESDGSFSRLFPEISIITNIDNDHLDYFGSFKNLQKAFFNFALNIPYYGHIVMFGDDPKLRELFKKFTKKIHYYGENENNDYILKGKDKIFEVLHQKKTVGELSLNIPGYHNVLNALAACIATRLTGLPWDSCFKGLNQYSGVDRRFQKIGEVDGIKVFDDYAHHPTEIRAVISGVRGIKAGKGKLYIVYQPHRYSRTRDCWQDSIHCFQGADQLYLMDIYPAGEEPIEGITSRNFSQNVSIPSQYVQDSEELLEILKKSLRKEDIVVTMGAGDVGQVAWQIVDLLKSRGKSF